MYAVEKGDGEEGGEEGEGGREGAASSATWRTSH